LTSELGVFVLGCSQGLIRKVRLPASLARPEGPQPDIEGLGATSAGRLQGPECAWGFQDGQPADRTPRRL